MVTVSPEPATDNDTANETAVEVVDDTAEVTPKENENESSHAGSIIGGIVVFAVAIGIGIGIGYAIWNDSSTSVATTTEAAATTTDFNTTGFDTTAGFDTTGAPTTTAPDFDTVNLNVNDLGEITGKYSVDFPLVKEFLNIPYAQPPVGDLRFKSPVPLDKWEGGHLDALEYGKKCIQNAVIDPSSSSEDCLHLNIWVPDNADQKEPLPVLLYIHGGAYWTGDNARIEEEGSFLANEQNIIVVKTNYRLGVLGFWYLEEKEDGQDFQGNWGLLDQRLAMKWVYDNIAAFGGNPELITLSGCSAGGQSVWFHLQEEGSWGYFQKAIAHSSPGGISYFNKEQAISFYQGNAKTLNCLVDDATDLACVRNTDIQELIDACWGENLLRNQGPWAQSLMKQMITQMAEPYAPVIDGESITDNTYQMIANDAIRPNTPIINEYATDEGEEFIVEVFEGINKRKNKVSSLYEQLGSAVFNDTHQSGGQRDGILVTPEQFELLMGVMYGTIGSEVEDNTVCDCVEQIFSVYNCTADCGGPENCDCIDTTTRWLTTWSWACNIRSSMQIAKNSTNAVFDQFYPVEVNVPYPKQKSLPSSMRSCHEKACHCVGRYYFFGTYERDWGDEIDADLRTFGKAIRDNYVTFMRTGKMDNFKPYDEQSWNSVNYMTPETSSPVISKRFSDECDVLDDINYYMNC